MAKQMRLRPVIIVLGFVGAFVAFAILQQSRANSQIAAAQRSGFPVTLAALNKWYADVPNASNAALKIVSASEALNTLKPQATFTAAKNHWNEGKALPPDLAESVQKVIIDNQQSLALLHEAAELKESRFPVDFEQWPFSTISWLGEFRQLANLLSIASMHYASTGKMERALEAYTDLINMTAAMVPEPILITQLIRVSCVGISQNTLEFLLSQHALSDAQLKQLETILAATENQGQVALKNALAGERCFGISTFNSAPSRMNQAPRPTSSRSWEDIVFGLVKTAGLFQSDFRFYMHVMQEWISASEMPIEQNLLKVREVNAEAQSRRGLLPVSFRLFSKMLLPAIHKGIMKSASSTASIRSAQLAVAIERYRLSHHQETLDSIQQLVPESIATLPKDPFNGLPLRFMKSGTGYMIYSVGEDLVDDNGNPKSDVVFRIVGARSTHF
jgi:hypothetical protein